jgi:hypothetical protein
MDPLSAIGSLVGIIDAIFSTYKTIKEITGLPKAFDEIGKGVPLIQCILRDARERLVEGPDVTDEEANVVEAILTPCHDKLLKLQQIFKQVAKAAKKEERSKDWAKIWAAYGKALRGIKAHRVETLMSDIMEGVKKLALSQVFKTVMKKDLAGIEEAIEKLSEVPQSLPDSEIETAGTINATQTVATGAYGQQNNTQGGVNTFNHGKFLATGEGQTQNIHYGKEY